MSRIGAKATTAASRLGYGIAMLEAGFTRNVIEVGVSHLDDPKV